jgi:preprotein translocase subunit SecD
VTKETKASLLAAALLLLCASASCATPGLLRARPRDQGGVLLLIAVKAEGGDAFPAVEQTMRIMEGRCDKLGVYCKAEPEGGGSNRFRLRVSGAKDMGRVKDILLATGMEMRPVVSPSSPAPIKSYPTRAEAEAAAGASNDVLPFVAEEGHGSFLVVERKPVVTGDDVREAHTFDLSVPERPYYEIMFSLKPDGAERLGRWTGFNFNHYLAIILNGQVRSAPYIKSQITDSGVIEGRFNKQQAEDVALVLSTGNLPAPAELIKEEAYKP